MFYIIFQHRRQHFIMDTTKTFSTFLYSKDQDVKNIKLDVHYQLSGQVKFALALNGKDQRKSNWIYKTKHILWIATGYTVEFG